MNVLSNTFTLYPVVVFTSVFGFNVFCFVFRWCRCGWGGWLVGCGRQAGIVEWGGGFGGRGGIAMVGVIGGKW